jgi:hypothetical protein
MPWDIFLSYAWGAEDAQDGSFPLASRARAAKR